MNDMEIVIPLLNAFLFGILILLTIRWVVLHYAVYRIKSHQGKPLDRMIEISSSDILNGLIRKRRKQVRLIMETSCHYDKRDLNDTPGSIPAVSPSQIESIFNSFRKKNLAIYIIPNEDVYIAKKQGLLSAPSKYFLNDEIITRLSKRELSLAKARKKAEREESEKARKEQQIFHLSKDEEYGLDHGIIQSGDRERRKYPIRIASVQTLSRRLDNWTDKVFDLARPTKSLALYLQQVGRGIDPKEL